MSDEYFTIERWEPYKEERLVGKAYSYNLPDYRFERVLKTAQAIEKENIQTKTAFKALSEELKESNGELEELKTRLAHVESELKKEQAVTDFYGDFGLWQTSGFSVDHTTEHKCKVSFEFDGERTSPAFIRGGKRARQRIKERKNFNAN